MFLTVTRGRSLAFADQNKQRFQGQIRGEGGDGGTLLLLAPGREQARQPASECLDPACPRGCPCPTGSVRGANLRGVTLWDGLFLRTASVKGRRQPRRHRARGADPEQGLRNLPAAEVKWSANPTLPTPTGREGSSPRAVSDPDSPRSSSPILCSNSCACCHAERYRCQTAQLNPR